MAMKDVAYVLDYDDVTKKEYPISTSSKGFFVIIANESSDSQQTATIQRFENRFNLRDKSGELKPNVREGINLTSNPGDNFDAFIDDVVLKYRPKEPPSFLMCLFMAKGNAEHTFQLSTSICPPKCHQLGQHQKEGDCQYRNYYSRVIHALGDHFRNIPKIFIMDVCRQFRYATVRKSTPPKTPFRKLKSAEHVPEDTDCFILFPCIHNYTGAVVHPNTALTENVVEVFENIGTEHIPKKRLQRESFAHRWLDDICRAICVRQTENANQRDAFVQPESINTLRHGVSLLKILQTQGVLPVERRPTIRLVSVLYDLFTGQL